METTVPLDRRIDGIAEVTFENALSPVVGRKQTALAFEEEVNTFRRTLLHAGPPGTSRWYDVAPGEKPGPRAIIYLRRGKDTGSITCTPPSSSASPMTRRNAFYAEHAVQLTTLLTPHVSAIYAYDVETTLTYVKDGEILPHPGV